MDVLMTGFYNAKMALVNLDDSSVETISLPAELFAEHIGGVQINTVLLERYTDHDPLIFGTGPLTGSFAPASCLMAASFFSPEKKVVHVPFMLNTGPQLKFSGIDFLVITGRAASPVIIELIDNTIRLTPGDDLSGTLSNREDMLLSRGRNCPEVVLLTGQAAENGSPHACLSTGLWGSLDKSSLGGLIGHKNIRTIALKAAGGIAFPAETIERGGSMALALKNQYGKQQFVVQEKMGSGDAARNLIRKHFKKSHACYHCPFPCMSYLEFPEPGSHSLIRGSKKQGVFLLDHVGFAALSKKRPTDAVILLKHCIERGIDPAAAAAGLDQTTPTEEARSQIDFFSSTYSDSIDATNTSETGKVPSSIYRMFGSGLPLIAPTGATDEFDTWEKKTALAMTLGICPILLLCFGHIRADELLAFLWTDAETLAAAKEKLAHAVNVVLAG